jgi:hypothetical protein
MRSIQTAASIDGLYAVLVGVCLFVCAVCGIEGGVQLHLSHEHPALRCVVLAMSEGAKTPAPACTSADEPGEPWRARLVVLNMAGFLCAGILWSKLRAARKNKLMLTDAPRDRISDRR